MSLSPIVLRQSTLHKSDLLHEQHDKYNIHRKSQECIQFGVVWSPPTPNTIDKDEGRYLFSCLDSGIVACWDVFDDNDGDSEGKKSDPIMKIRASHNVLYNIDFYKISSANQWYLSICGDDGVILYKWSDIHSQLTGLMKNLPKSSPSQGSKSMTIDITPFTRYRTHPLPPNPYQYHNPYLSSTQMLHQNQGSEVNCTAMDSTRNVLLGAGGDLFGCYQWDLETGKLLGNLQHCNGGHTNYLHSVSTISDGSGFVFTGGEDETWACGMQSKTD